MSHQATSLFGLNGSTSSSNSFKVSSVNLQRQLSSDNFHLGKTDSSVNYPIFTEGNSIHLSDNGLPITAESGVFNTSITATIPSLQHCNYEFVKGKSVDNDNQNPATHLKYNRVQSLQVSESFQFVTEKSKTSPKSVSNKSVNENLHQLLSRANNKSQDSESGRILWNPIQPSSSTRRREWKSMARSSGSTIVSKLTSTRYPRGAKRMQDGSCINIGNAQSKMVSRIEEDSNDQWEVAASPNRLHGPC